MSFRLTAVRRNLSNLWVSPTIIFRGRKLKFRNTGRLLVPTRILCENFVAIRWGTKIYGLGTNKKGTAAEHIIVDTPSGGRLNYQKSKHKQYKAASSLGPTRAYNLSRSVRPVSSQLTCAHRHTDKPPRYTATTAAINGIYLCTIATDVAVSVCVSVGTCVLWKNGRTDRVGPRNHVKGSRSRARRGNFKRHDLGIFPPTAVCATTRLPTFTKLLWALVFIAVLDWKNCSKFLAVQ